MQSVTGSLDSGDEFLVILADTTAEYAENVVDRIYDHIQEWSDARHLENFEISLSIGISQWLDGESLDEVLTTNN